MMNLKNNKGITLGSLVVLIMIILMLILTIVTVILRRGLTKRERDEIVIANDIEQIRKIYTDLKNYQSYTEQGVERPVNKDEMEKNLKDSLLNEKVSVTEEIIKEGTEDEVRKLTITMPSGKVYTIDGTTTYVVDVVKEK